MLGVKRPLAKKIWSQSSGVKERRFAIFMISFPRDSPSCSFNSTCDDCTVFLRQCGVDGFFDDQVPDIFRNIHLVRGGFFLDRSIKRLGKFHAKHLDFWCFLMCHFVSSRFGHTLSWATACSIPKAFNARKQDFRFFSKIFSGANKWGSGHSSPGVGRVGLGSSAAVGLFP